MYARVALFEDHDPAQMDELIRRLDERSQQHDDFLPEARGFLGLFDRESGKSVGITFFDSLAAIETAEPKLAAFPRSYPDSLKGRRVAVGVYEVGVADLPERIAVD
jgi:hypothetical protein